MPDNAYKLFLQDLVFLLKEQIEQKYSEETSAASDKEFNAGQVLALYGVLDLIKTQAIAFGIPSIEFGLEDFDLERFLNVKK